jgi:hypothetical protein
VDPTGSFAVVQIELLLGGRVAVAITEAANVLRVSVKKVNILSVELDEPLDEAGFRHVATSIGLPLGAQRIGASV